MRWPFANWLRGAPGKADPSPGAGEAARSAADPDSGPVPRSVARPDAWRDLPPLQRAVGAAPLTAPSAAFAHDLAGRRAPDPMLAPLGHDVTADGPAGLVSGIAVPLVRPAPSGPDRRPAPALPAPAASGRGRPAAQRAAASVAAWPLGGTREGAAGGSPAAGVPGLAPRTLPIARLATATPALSATRVADATAPAPVLALARTVASEVPSGASGLPPVTADVSGRTDAATPAGTLLPARPTAPVEVTGPAPGSVPEAAAAEPPALAGGDDAARPVVARRTLGESRRLGLGAPLTGRPPLAARETGRPELPVARLARRADLQASTSAHPPIGPTVPAAAAASAPLPRLVVARRSTSVPGPASVLPEVSDEPPGALDPGSAGTPVDASTETAGESTPGGTPSLTRPLVGDSGISVSRPAREDAATDADAEGAAERGATSLRLAGTLGAVPATTSPVAGPGPGPTSAVAASGPATRTAPAPAPLVAGRPIRASLPAALAILEHGPTAEPAPVVARLAIPSPGSGGAGSDASAAPLGGAARSPAPRGPGAATGRDERPVIARAAPAVGRGALAATASLLPLARSAVGTVVPDAAESGQRGGVVSWAAGAGFTTGAPPPASFVQRAVTIDEVAVTPSGDAAGPAESGATAGSAGEPGATGAGGAGTDYEELADHVYDKIRARLTTELLLDRERAGMLVDG